MRTVIQTKMKTKVICIMLLTCLFFLKASLHVCICPKTSQEINTSSDAVSISMQVDQDVCSDCGHTKSCCIEQQQNVELASGDASFLENQCFTQIVPTVSPVFEFPLTALAEDRFVNKAPPQDLLQTPVSLHQKLLV